MILRALVGALMPLRLSAALLLRSELRKLRPGQPDLPPQAIDAFVDVAIAASDLMGHTGTRRMMEVVAWVERDAGTIADLLAGGVVPDQGAESHWVKILLRHGLLQ